MKKIIYLDRDGVINADAGYTHKVEDFKFMDGVFEACRKFLELGFEIIVITNQSGIGRGYYTEKDYEILTAYMLEQFSKNGVKILKVYHCPHPPDAGCSCRKPKAGMIEQSLEEFAIDLQSSWLIGDKISDMECAENAGIPNKILITENSVQNNALFTARNLQDCLKHIKA